MEESTASSRSKHMGVRISVPWYKLVYERDTEDIIWQSRSREEEGMMRERSQGREEERRKRLEIMFG